MFSKQLTDYAQKAFDARLPYFGRRKTAIEREVSECRNEEKVLMKFLYGTMPLRDAGEYDFSVFHSFASHAVFLAETMAWCREIPEDIFLNYVLYYRVNTEAIESCRPFFYQQLLPRIKGLSPKEAALEINYWCAENGSYEASDSRTISPMTMYRSGKGRCGEESVFAVTAFRSVGIPARQVYTPRWAHCDDNHAWVEVYVDGAWHFLGACEPEEILDRGWFSHASSRALFVHTLTFSDYVKEGSQGPREVFAGRDGQVVYYNQTASYARTRELEILVQDEREKPVAQAEVMVEILNMAEYSSAAALFTNTEGRVHISLGLGSVRLHAEKDGCWTEKLISAADTGKAVLYLPSSPDACLSENVNLLTTPCPAKDLWKEYSLQAPDDFPVHSAVLTREQKQKNRERLKLCKVLREERIRGEYREELANNYPCEAEILRAAAGNFQEIYLFLSQDESPDRRALLHHLSIKDFRDARADVLNLHLEHAAVFREEWEALGKRDIYVSYLLNPRIYLEELTDYRSYIQHYFTEEEKEGFKKNPESIWQYIQKTIKNHEEMDYHALCSTPAGCLELSHGSDLSQKILFVAICRTLGIPARINPVNIEAEWYHQNGFLVLSCGQRETGQRPARLTLVSDEKIPWQYYQQWTIGRLEGSRFRTLDYTGKTIAGKKTELLLAPGTYRLITANRLPKGSQNTAELVFRLEGGQEREVVMYLPEGENGAELVNYQIEDVEVYTEQEGDKPVSLSVLLRKKMVLLFFLQEGEEPTEHVLNELLEQGEALLSLDIQILFILRNREALGNVTLARVMKKFPQIEAVFGDFEEVAEPVARRIYAEPENYPLLAAVACQPCAMDAKALSIRAFYGICGYHVGIVGLLPGIIREGQKRIFEDL